MAWLLISIFAAGCWVFCWGFLTITQDAKEPLMIPHTAPYVGHLVGILRHGSKYFYNFSAGYNASAYTLRLPWRRIYIITSPKIVAAVDRHSRTLSFAPNALEVVKRITVPSKRGLEIVKKSLQDEKGIRSVHSDTIQAMNTTLAPGTALDHTVSELITSALRLLDSAYMPTKHKEIELFSWTRSLLTQASTSALYGVKSNPLQDPAVEAGLWAVEKDFAYLGLNFLPTIICPKAHRGRKDFFAGFEKFYREKGHESASQMVQARYEVLQGWNLCEADIAHFDLNICLGLLISSVPTTFWTLYHVYGQPSLLEEVRTAVYSQIERPGEGPTRHVNIARVAANCPLIPSIVQETLRVHSHNLSSRRVLKDTLLDNKYLLKEGSTILIPSAELHKISSVWGPSAAEFDARRFCPDKGVGARKPTSVFRAFGGGSAMCPGRFLATNKIIAVLVIMVLKFDLAPINDEPWPQPESQSNLATAVLAPRKDIRVQIREREGYDSGCWTFEWKSEGSGPEL
ncbi:MAG: hypothetical protein Q9172_006565 [Xanthocarpia lactea]